MLECVWRALSTNATAYTGGLKSTQQIKNHDCNYDNPYLLHQPKYDNTDKMKGIKCCSMNTVVFPHQLFFWLSQVCFYLHKRCAFTLVFYFFYLIFYPRVCRVIYSSFTSTSDSHLGFKYTWRHVRDLASLPATAEYVSMRYKMMVERVWAHF